MAYRPTLLDEDDQLAPPAPMGAQVGAAAPDAAAATVPAVIGEYDKFNRGYDYADARRKELADLAGVSPFDAETTRDAASIIAGRMRGGLQTDDDTKVKDPVTGKLVSTKPQWYKPGSTGPSDPNMPLNAIGVGLGSIAQGKQAQANSLAQNPYRTVGNKMLDQSRATGAATLSALANYFGNAQAKNEDRRLDHAAKEAQMYRTLNPSKGGTGDPQFDAAMAALRFDRDAKNLTLAGAREGRFGEKDAANVAHEVDKASPTSPLAKRNAQIAVELGLVNPESAAKFSDNDWKRWASTLNQKDQQRFALGVKKFEQDLENEKRANKLVEDQEIKIVQDANKRAHEIADMAIQGGNWSTKPSERDRHDVIGLIDSQATLVNGAKKIAELRGELERRHGSVERGIEFLGRKDINLFPEDAALLRRINGEKKAMDAAYSQIFQYGVPSGIEMQRTGQLSGTTGLNSLLFPQEFYSAVEQEAKERLTPQINNRGFWFQGQQMPAPQQVQDQRVRFQYAPTQSSTELEQIANPPAAPAPSSTLPGEPPPVPPPITQSSTVRKTVEASPAGTPTSETERDARGREMPTEAALREQAAPAGSLPEAPVPPFPATIAKGGPKAPPPAAGAQKADPNRQLSGTINGKPWKGTQADLDEIKKQPGADKLKIEVN